MAYQYIDTVTPDVGAKTGAEKINNNATESQYQSGYFTAGGTANAITLSNPSGVSATTYTTGHKMRFRVSSTNTGAATVNVDGLGIKPLKTLDGSDLPASYLPTDREIEIVYDGVNFKVYPPVGTAAAQIPTNDALTSIQSVSADATVTAPLAHTTSRMYVNAATATITIPDGVPVGGRILVKKINATQGTITINRSGLDTITRAALTSVTLNADGDFWLMEKVTSTRWELIDGVESGSNSNGDYFRYACGTQACYLDIVVTDQAISGSYGTLYTGERLWSYPVVFIDSYVVCNCGTFKFGTSASWGTSAGATATDATLRGIDIFSRAAGTNTSIRANATGRWYA